MKRLLPLCLLLLTSCRTTQFLNDGRLPTTQVYYRPGSDTIRPPDMRPYRPENYSTPKRKH